MKVTRTLAVAAILAAASASTLLAQEPQPPPQPRPPQAPMPMHPPGTGMRPGAMPMHMSGAHPAAPDAVPGIASYAPGRLLAHRDTLALSEQQVADLQKLADGVKAVHDKAMTDIASHRAELEKAWEADKPDANVLRQHAQAMAEARQTAHLEMLTAAAKAKGLLTSGQRDVVAQWMRAGRGHGHMMRGMRGMRGMGGMGHQMPCCQGDSGGMQHRMPPGQTPPAPGQGQQHQGGAGR